VTAATGTLRYFLTYRGVRLPLQLTEPLDPAALRHRNTFFRAGYDADGRMQWCEKLVYGEVEMRHDYQYGDGGALVRAVIRVGEEDAQVVEVGGG
jgi:hypothetical protein